MPEEQNPLNQKVERDVRMLIGDLHMQLIVTRALLEQQQSQQATNGFDQSDKINVAPRPA